MNTLSKRDLINQSIENIFKLLTDIVCSPRNYVQNKQILIGLKSQGSLCALDLELSIQNKHFKIRPVSLNTLKKRLSENHSESNFHKLDKLRVQAQEAIQKFSEEQNTPNKKSHSALKDQIGELKSSVAMLHAVNMVLVQALEVNRRDLITISDTTNTGLRQRRINDAINRIVKILGLNPAPFDEVTILPMKAQLQLVPSEKANR